MEFVQGRPPFQQAGPGSRSARWHSAEPRPQPWAELAPSQQHPPPPSLRPSPSRGWRGELGLRREVAWGMAERKWGARPPGLSGGHQRLILAWEDTLSWRLYKPTSPCLFDSCGLPLICHSLTGLGVGRSEPGLLEEGVLQPGPPSACAPATPFSL